MPQSLSRVLVHLVFSTKSREPLLSPPVQSELHPYLAMVLTNHDCPSLQVGGTANHVHLLFGLSRTIALAEIAETVKTSSSKWLKTKGPEFSRFHWQSGYGAFSIGQSDAEKVVAYIRMQQQHHRNRSFEDEYRLFLRRYQVQYDERYVWD